MKIEPHSHLIDYTLFGLNTFAGFLNFSLGEPYSYPIGGICMIGAGFAAYSAFSHAHVLNATPGELSDLEEVVSEPFVCGCFGSESVFKQKIRKISNLVVENLQGKVSNVRETQGFLKKQLVDLIDEDGKSIPCTFPKSIHLQEGDNIVVYATLKKIKVGEDYRNGLKAHSVAYMS